MSVWPSTLPTLVAQDGYQESQQSGAIRTEMEHGPPKQRNRFTATILTWQVTFEMTSAQVTTFWIFYRTTLKNGALSFTGLPVPRTQGVGTHRFDTSSPPEVTIKGWDYYTVACSIETLP